MAPKNKSKEMKHSNIICLRLNDTELELLNHAADRTRLSRSDYLRNLILNHMMTARYEIVVESDLIKLHQVQIYSVGIHMNLHKRSALYVVPIYFLAPSVLRNPLWLVYPTDELFHSSLVFPHPASVLENMCRKTFCSKVYRVDSSSSFQTFRNPLGLHLRRLCWLLLLCTH